jgi:DNA end-binding protein Ku
MPRPTWSGSISFGLVNVPVKVYTAVHDHTVHFHQLDKKTGARVKYKKVSAKSGRELEADDIERGFEVTKGKYVVIDDDEIKEMRPESTGTIEVSDFVELAAVDPIYYENTYWLGTEGEASKKAYRLLLAAMEKAQRVAIGTVVMRNKQYLAAIRPLDGALAMSTMRFADEVTPRSEIDGIPTSRTKPTAGELKLASQIISALESEWEPSKYHDTYTDELEGLIKAKAKKGTRKSTDEPADREPEEKSNVLDLMEALQASVAEHRKRGSAKSSGTKSRAKKSAKKPAAKKRSA